jgi:hypothetical protein
LGIYLLALSMEGVSPGLLESPSFYVVFNLGQSEEDHDAAIDWVHANLVPVPSMLLVLGAAVLVRPRRR